MVVGGKWEATRTPEVVYCTVLLEPLQDYIWSRLGVGWGGRSIVLPRFFLRHLVSFAARRDRLPVTSMAEHRWVDGGGPPCGAISSLRGSGDQPAGE